MELSHSQQTLKKALLEYCVRQQSQRVDTSREAMENIKEMANEEEPSAEEDFDSFKEQLRNDQDMYAKQYNEALNGLNILRKIQFNLRNEVAGLGAVVKTNHQNFFLCINIGQFSINNEKFFGMSLESPLAKEMIGKKQGESFKFRDKVYQITELF
jgi:hypothetical protein